MLAIDKYKRGAGIFFSLSYISFILELSVIYYLRSRQFSVDDSYITYRYAFHLKEGYGLVFNVGEAYYGTTAAGYAVFLAAISLLATAVGNLFGAGASAWLDIPSLAVGVSTLALASVAGLLPVIARAREDWRQWLICVIGAMLLFSDSSFNDDAGHETYAFLAVALLGTVCVGYFRKYVTGALLLAVAASFRPDAVLMAGIVPCFDWMRSRLTIRDYLKDRRVIAFLTVYTVVFGSWLLYLSYHFGTPIPGTMTAKKAQATLNYYEIYKPKALVKFVKNALSGIGYYLMLSGIFFAVASFVMTSLRGWKSRAIPQASQEKPGNFIAGVWLVFPLLTAEIYSSFHVSFWQWYGAPVLFSFLLVAFVGWTNLNNWMSVVSSRIGKNVFGAKFALHALPVVMLAVLVHGDLPRFSAWAQSDHPNPHIFAYSEIIDFIHKDSPDGAVIQMSEPGSFGYHLGPKYTIVDELGLITPGAATALVKGDYAWTINKYHPKYLVCAWRGSYSACNHNFQDNGYEFVGEFNKEFWVPRIENGAKLYRLKKPADAQSEERSHQSGQVGVQQ